MSGLGGRRLLPRLRPADRRGGRRQRDRPRAGRGHARSATRPASRRPGRWPPRSPARSARGARCTPGSAGARGPRSSRPAIHYARDGFGATRAYRHFAGEQVGALRADPRSARVFLRDGRPPAVGTPIVQADLARTLERLAAAGADDFYRGALARALAAGCQAAGGLVTAARPRRVRARDPGADRAPLPGLHGARGAAELHGLGAAPGARHRRALRPRRDGPALRRSGPHAGRGEEARLRRPRAVERRPALRWRRRSASSSRPRTSRGARPRSIPKRAAPAGVAAATAPGDTTYFCVVDGDGNAVSGIQSINSAFGSGVTAGETRASCSTTA